MSFLSRRGNARRPLRNALAKKAFRERALPAYPCAYMKLYRVEITAASDKSPEQSHVFVYEEGMTLNNLETAVEMLTRHLESEKRKTLADKTAKTILLE